MTSEDGVPGSQFLKTTNGKVQRLGEIRRAKWLETPDTRKCEDIVWSAWQHAAVERRVKSNDLY